MASIYANLLEQKKALHKKRVQLPEYFLGTPIGSLRKDQGDGYENVTKKESLRCLNVGKFPIYIHD